MKRNLSVLQDDHKAGPIAYDRKIVGGHQDRFALVIETLQNFLNSKPGYRCDHCGFETRKLYWQCPSCQKWDRLGPILGAEGD